MYSNMTRETGEQNPPLVFGYDPYPPLERLNRNQEVPFTNIPTNYACGDQPVEINQVALPPTFCVTERNIPPTIHPFGAPSYPVPQTSYSFGTARPMPEVMQFPFLSMNTPSNSEEFRCKRKTDSPPLQPMKQHITEERMAEHLSKLHISSETPTVSETETSKIRRLYMCEEMRKLQTESIIPKSLLEKIERPCTALVLWKPPAARWISPPQYAEFDENDNNNTELSSERNMADIVSNMEMDNC